MEKIKDSALRRKKIVLQEVPYKILKEYLDKQRELEELEEIDPNPYNYSTIEIYDPNEKDEDDL